MKPILFLLLLLFAGCAVTPPTASKPQPVVHPKITEAEKRYFKSAKFDRDLDALNLSLDVNNAQLGAVAAQQEFENETRSYSPPLPYYVP